MFTSPGQGRARAKVVVQASHPIPLILEVGPNGAHGVPAAKTIRLAVGGTTWRIRSSERHVPAEVVKDLSFAPDEALPVTGAAQPDPDTVFDHSGNEGLKGIEVGV